MKKTNLLAMGLSVCIAFTATSLLAQEKPAQKPAPAADDGHFSPRLNLRDPHDVFCDQHDFKAS